MTEKTSARRRGRAIVGMLAGGLALSVLPFGVPASAQTTALPPAQGTNNACPVTEGVGSAPDTTEVPEDGFTDVAQSNIHEFAVDCVAWYQITSGTSATRYSPDRLVQRDQMATFVAQLVDYVADRTNSTTDGLGPVPTGNRFQCDLTTANVHFENIQRLAAAGIVVGTGTRDGEDCFNPGGAITRAQMASFIRQAQDVVGSDVPRVTNVDYFGDDDGDIHEVNINAIAAEGLVRGTGTNADNEALYSPGRNVPRDQMASFLANKLDRLIQDVNAALAGDVERPPVATVTPSAATVTKGSNYSGTVTAERATIDFVTVSGCGLLTTLRFPTVGSANSATQAISVLIPPTQPNGPCTLTVVTNFTDIDAFGGEDRTDTDRVTVTVTSPVVVTTTTTPASTTTTTAVATTTTSITLPV